MINYTTWQPYMEQLMQWAPLVIRIDPNLRGIHLHMLDLLC